MVVSTSQDLALFCHFFHLDFGAPIAHLMSTDTLMTVFCQTLTSKFQLKNSRQKTVILTKTLDQFFILYFHVK